MHKNKYACIINMHRITLNMHKMVLLQMMSHKKHAAKTAKQNFDCLVMERDGTLRALLRAH